MTTILFEGVSEQLSVPGSDSCSFSGSGSGACSCSGIGSGSCSCSLHEVSTRITNNQLITFIGTKMFSNTTNYKDLHPLVTGNPSFCNRNPSALKTGAQPATQQKALNQWYSLIF